MFDFIRPELRAQIVRFRECLVALALLALAVWFWRAGGLLALLSPIVALAAAALGWLGVQRARFRKSGEGPGVVQVVEGQISYFGPETGGAVAVGDLQRLILDNSAHPPHWRLTQRGLPELCIPLDAKGADALFDAFAHLPGLRMERMLSEMHKGAPQAVVIWEGSPTRPKAARLH